MSDPATPEPAPLAFLREGLEAEDLRLARRTGTPVVESPPDPRHALVIARRDGALEIAWTGRGKPGPVRVDFTGPMARRWRTTSRKQPLARSLGIHRALPRVLDATAGLGRDAMTLAVLGCQVIAVERHQILAALLADGLRRAGEDRALAEAVQRIRLVTGDARAFMADLAGEERPDCVFLDPMYARTGSAQVKKESQVLRALVPAEDHGSLVAAAMSCARRRVVVKRHPHAPPPTGTPDHVVAGTRVRFHVYLVS
jgi:16S rRNA (guanine1516-N2)-methyltransferase